MSRRWLSRHVPQIVAGFVLALAFGMPRAALWRDPPVAAAATTTISVTTTLDELDGDARSFDALIATPGGAGISLREAMTAANVMSDTEQLTIGFDIPASDPGYETDPPIWRIQPGPIALPPLTRGNIVIDGTTQPGAATSAHPVIVLDGANVYEAVGLNNGLTLASSGNIVRGIAVVWFWDTGILIAGDAAADNQVAGCFVGTLDAAQGRMPNYYGIDIRDGASDNMIGGADPGDRNIISGNDNAGVRIDGATTISNTLQGNWIGLDSSGAAARDNTYYGVTISGGASDNFIGIPGGGNTIAGNGVGIWVAGSDHNHIIGNTIGLAPDRTTPIGNSGGGVFLVDGSSSNTIGGGTAAERNIIASNGAPESADGQGVFVGRYYQANAPAAQSNQIQGNYIGVDASGLLPRGNYRQGILLGSDAESNQIGGDAPNLGNVIAYNGLSGIHIMGKTNRAANNLVGVGADGSTPLGNQQYGIRISGEANIVGPDNLLAFNQLSGLLTSGEHTIIQKNAMTQNRRSGICVMASQSTIVDNVITLNGGADPTWDVCAIAGGISVLESSQILIRDNSIAQNLVPGVMIQGGEQNRMLSNRISDNAAGGIVLTQNANNGINAPKILSIQAAEVYGIGCPACHVEIFADLNDQGAEFLGATTASPVDGTFAFALGGAIPSDHHITATNTDNNGNTSTFGMALKIHSPPNHTVFLPLLNY